MQVELIGGPKDGEQVSIAKYVPVIEFTLHGRDGDYTIRYKLVNKKGKLRYVYERR